MATICPECNKKTWKGPGKRVEMIGRRLPQPDFTTKNDRFPGEIVSIPAVYHCHTKWICPVCAYTQAE